MKAPKTGQYIRLRFYDPCFDSDWVNHNSLCRRYWNDPENPEIKCFVPIVIQDGYVLEWSKAKNRVILQTTKTSDNEDMAWFIPLTLIIKWKAL